MLQEDFVYSHDQASMSGLIGMRGKPGPPRSAVRTLHIPSPDVPRIVCRDRHRQRACTRLALNDVSVACGFYATDVEMPLPQTLDDEVGNEPAWRLPSRLLSTLARTASPRGSPQRYSEAPP